MDKTVHAIDLNTGKIWGYLHKNFPYFSSPALTEELVIIGGRDKGLHAIERMSGEQKCAILPVGALMVPRLSVVEK